MDCSLPVVTEGDGGLGWADRHSLDSDDDHTLWIDDMPTTSSGSAAHIPHTGQLSPISTEMDIPGAVIDRHGCPSAGSSSSAAPTMVHSTSSTSSNDSWSSLDYVDPDDVTGGNFDSDIHWDQDSDDVLTVPKMEPLDEDDFRMEDVKEAPLTPVASTNAPTPAQPKIKRPRGRPRKHPLTPVATTNKVTKGRSKTGCITCRKRKKKCDEAKPRCMNCEKNAVVCEGYPEKQIWKSGREKMEEERLSKTQNLPAITMQPLFNGLETAEDMIFWKHYNVRLSAVLTVEGEHKNAFKDMLVPIATKHQGLMHSILSLSSKHLDLEDPYTASLLQKHPNVTLESLRERAEFHHQTAFEKLCDDFPRLGNKGDPDYKFILAARYGQMLCLLMETLAEGSPHGQHRLHLFAYQQLIHESPPEDPAFLAFVVEFFQYHIFADELIRFPEDKGPRLAADDWMPMAPIHPPRLLGVADGLFNYMCQITTIRNQIRVNMAAQIDPVVDYTSLYRAAEIDAAVRDWAPRWPSGDSRDRVSLLYKQMIWVYLFRTIYPPSPSSFGHSAAASSTSLTAALEDAMPSDPSLSATPPRSPSASCASSPLPKVDTVLDHDDFGRRRHSISTPRASDEGDKSEGGATAAAAAATSAVDGRLSPPPIRRPPDHDSRITIAVDESLAILESFKPSDPAQTLLLIPCLVIGTASFAPNQQERVRAAIRRVRGYTGLRNTDRVTELLEEVWSLMGQGDWLRVWDWQGVANSLKMDFLCG